MQIVSIGDNLHEISKMFFSGKKKKEKYFDMSLLKILHRVLRVKQARIGKPKDGSFRQSFPKSM